MTYVGVDWAGGTWVVVAATDGGATVTTQPSMLAVWYEHHDAAAILVDVPIGLPEDGPRECDVAAREILGARGSTVFSVPARAAVVAGDYERAVEANEVAGCGGLGSQSWGLVPRISEVDVFLRTVDEARAVVYESHPEVCFATLAGEQLPKKDTDVGFERRLDVLADVDPAVGRDVREFTDRRRDGNAEWHHRIRAGRLDDVLDAAVLAVTGKRIGLSRRGDGSYPALPAGDDPPQDGEGLPMEIVYPGE
ncbi:DUF429 domain-containing protein [Halobacteriales archaeon QS_1_68_20]|nr:MAG: DUF429 domain-containing protein [Halobacteriales archaeon QS_1_68_20]